MIFCPVGITELYLAIPKWVSYLIGIPKQIKPFERIGMRLDRPNEFLHGTLLLSSEFGFQKLPTRVILATDSDSRAYKS